MQNRDINKGTTSDRDLGDKVRDNWDQFRMKVKEKWSDIKDRDIDTYKGKRREDLSGYIGQKTGSRREEVDRELDTLARDTGYNFGP